MTTTSNRDFTRTIEALKAHADKDDSRAWKLADALHEEIGEGVGSKAQWDALQDALRNEGLEYSTTTLTIYRHIAAAWPAERRIPGLSFSAHRGAIPVEGIAGADTTMEQLLAKVAEEAGGYQFVSKRMVTDELGRIRQTFAPPEVAAEAKADERAEKWAHLKEGVTLTKTDVRALVATANGLKEAEKMTAKLARVSAMINEIKEAEIAKAKATAAKATARKARREGPAAKATTGAKPAPRKLRKLGQKGG